MLTVGIASLLVRRQQHGAQSTAAGSEASQICGLSYHELQSLFSII